MYFIYFYVFVDRHRSKFICCVFNECICFLIVSVICTAFLQCHHNCVCAFVTVEKSYFLTYLRYIVLVDYITKVFCTRKLAFRILLLYAKNVDTINRTSIAIVNEAIW